MFNDFDLTPQCDEFAYEDLWEKEREYYEQEEK